MRWACGWGFVFGNTGGAAASASHAAFHREVKIRD